jgi:hypothetical protein
MAEEKRLKKKPFGIWANMQMAEFGRQSTCFGFGQFHCTIAF